MKRIGVVLAGCGHRDGTEIHEAVLAMLSLEQAGANLECLSLDKPQAKVLNHLNGSPLDENRNMMQEAARIARGNISAMTAQSAQNLDGVVLPGGFGAAYNLCSFAERGAEMNVDAQLQDFLVQVNERGKPIGAICISPVILAKVFGKKRANVTIGDDPDVASEIEKMGATHVECPVDDCYVDKENRLVTTPAFMLAKSPLDMFPGIQKLAYELLKLAA